MFAAVEASRCIAYAQRRRTAADYALVALAPYTPEPRDQMRHLPHAIDTEIAAASATVRLEALTPERWTREEQAPLRSPRCRAPERKLSADNPDSTQNVVLRYLHAHPGEQCAREIAEELHGDTQAMSSGLRWLAKRGLAVITRREDATRNRPQSTYFALKEAQT
ncbi:MAG: hypothetical protein WC565_07595 [Parcubacteria group bacterium]